MDQGPFVLHVATITVYQVLLCTAMARACRCQGPTLKWICPKVHAMRYIDKKPQQEMPWTGKKDASLLRCARFKGLCTLFMHFFPSRLVMQH